MLLGVISDTHGYLSAEACEALEACEAIIHAGDIGSTSVLLKLEAIAPVTAVLGNCDYNDYGPFVEAVANPCFDGVRFKVVHRSKDTGLVDPAVSMVINGHTHKAKAEMRDGLWYVNPGSASSPREGHRPSIALVSVADGMVEYVKIVEL